MLDGRSPAHYKEFVTRSWRILLAVALLISLGEAAYPATLRVTLTPEQPKSSDTVRIAVQSPQPIQGHVTLQYQLVDPGHYIELADSAFKKGWVSVPMIAAGDAGDALKANRFFVAELPDRLQIHRRLVRYRILVNDTVAAPLANEPVPNFAYFVYDGVPSWRGAINPMSRAPGMRRPTLFGTNVMCSLPVYQLIAKKSAIEKTTWFQQAPWGDDAARKRYNFTGTFIADDGKVYDHVKFRARGGQWRYAMGKNMWKFDFNRGQHLQARGDSGQPYRTKWEKLNLGACIQQGNYSQRGEQGMFEAVAFKLFNLAGVEAPLTHWVHFRIIDGEEENPANQYEGDFWGLYLATENVDDAFLKEHALPAGNLYKVEFHQPELHSHTPYATPSNDDAQQFMASYRMRHDESWWREHFDLPRYYSYRSIVECVHHYDIGSGKNYYYYQNPQTGRWSMLPWDVDLTWADYMYGSGLEPFCRTVLPVPAFRLEYENRLREIRDLLFNSEQMDRLIEEMAALISDPKGGASFVDADRAKWDYHPMMASRWVDPEKAGQGRFYQSSRTKDFHGMLELMKQYVRARGAWVDEVLLGHTPIPATPKVATAGPLDFSAGALHFRVGTESAPEQTRFEWRLAEVTLEANVRPDRKYEITPLWQTNGTATVPLPLTLLSAGRTYRVRARAQDSAGRYGHWSAPVQFTVPGSRSTL